MNTTVTMIVFRVSCHLAVRLLEGLVINDCLIVAPNVVLWNFIDYVFNLLVKKLRCNSSGEEHCLCTSRFRHHLFCIRVLMWEKKKEEYLSLLFAKPWIFISVRNF